MNMIKVNNENPNEHWQFVSVTDCVVLDLGCGRWEHVEHREKDWPTTPEYFNIKGAKKVIAVDGDENEILWFNKKYSHESGYVFIHSMINSPNILEHLITEYKPNCIKIDIEGGEINLINLSDDIFNLVNEYYIETHNDQLYYQCILKLAQNRYDIYQQIDLVHTNGGCKVIFAKKIK